MSNTVNLNFGPFDDVSAVRKYGTVIVGGNPFRSLVAYYRSLGQSVFTAWNSAYFDNTYGKSMSDIQAGRVSWWKEGPTAEELKVGQRVEGDPDIEKIISTEPPYIEWPTSPPEKYIPEASLDSGTFYVNSLPTINLTVDPNLRLQPTRWLNNENNYTTTDQIRTPTTTSTVSTLPIFSLAQTNTGNLRTYQFSPAFAGSLPETFSIDVKAGLERLHKGVGGSSQFKAVLTCKFQLNFELVDAAPQLAASHSLDFIYNTGNQKYIVKPLSGKAHKYTISGGAISLDIFEPSIVRERIYDPIPGNPGNTNDALPNSPANLLSAFLIGTEDGYELHLSFDTSQLKETETLTITAYNGVGASQQQLHVTTKSGENLVLPPRTKPLILASGTYQNPTIHVLEVDGAYKNLNGGQLITQQSDIVYASRNGVYTIDAEGFCPEQPGISSSYPISIFGKLIALEPLDLRPNISSVPDTSATIRSNTFNELRFGPSWGPATIKTFEYAPTNVPWLVGQDIVATASKGVNFQRYRINGRVVYSSETKTQIASYDESYYLDWQSRSRVASDSTWDLSIRGVTHSTRGAPTAGYIQQWVGLTETGVVLIFTKAGPTIKYRYRSILQTPVFGSDGFEVVEPSPPGTPAELPKVVKIFTVPERGLLFLLTEYGNVLSNDYFISAVSPEATSNVKAFWSAASRDFSQNSMVNGGLVSVKIDGRINQAGYRLVNPLSNGIFEKVVVSEDSKHAVGLSESGQLHPQHLFQNPFFNQNFTDIASGEDYIAAIKSSGAVYLFKIRENALLGVGPAEGRISDEVVYPGFAKLTSSQFVYDGSPKQPSIASTFPSGTNIEITYANTSTIPLSFTNSPPTLPGVYSVKATAENYSEILGEMSIVKAKVTVEIVDQEALYTGQKIQFLVPQSSPPVDFKLSYTNQETQQKFGPILNGEVSGDHPYLPGKYLVDVVFESDLYYTAIRRSLTITPNSGIAAPPNINPVNAAGSRFIEHEVQIAYNPASPISKFSLREVVGHDGGNQIPVTASGKVTIPAKQRSPIQNFSAAALAEGPGGNEKERFFFQDTGFMPEKSLFYTSEELLSEIKYREKFELRRQSGFVGKYFLKPNQTIKLETGVETEVELSVDQVPDAQVDLPGIYRPNGVLGVNGLVRPVFNLETGEFESLSQIVAAGVATGFYAVGENRLTSISNVDSAVGFLGAEISALEFSPYPGQPVPVYKTLVSGGKFLIMFLSSGTYKLKARLVNRIDYETCRWFLQSIDRGSLTVGVDHTPAGWEPSRIFDRYRRVSQRLASIPYAQRGSFLTSMEVNIKVEVGANSVVDHQNRSGGFYIGNQKIKGLYRGASVLIGSTTSTPSAPTITGVVVGDAQLFVNFTAPTNSTGYSITGYQYSINDGATWSPTASLSTGFAIPNLVNNTSYRIRLRAVNLFGPGQPSNQVVASPDAPGFQSVFGSMYLPGILGNWSILSSPSMTLVDDFIWETTVAITNSTSVQFKFAVGPNYDTDSNSDGLPDNWGDTPPTNLIGDAGSNQNIVLPNLGAGSYKIRFNDSDYSYTITKI